MQIKLEPMKLSITLALLAVVVVIAAGKLNAIVLTLLAAAWLCKPITSRRKHDDN